MPQSRDSAEPFKEHYSYTSINTKRLPLDYALTYDATVGLETKYIVLVNVIFSPLSIIEQFHCFVSVLV